MLSGIGLLAAVDCLLRLSYGAAFFPLSCGRCGCWACEASQYPWCVPREWVVFFARPVLSQMAGSVGGWSLCCPCWRRRFWCLRADLLIFFGCLFLADWRCCLWSCRVLAFCCFFAFLCCTRNCFWARWSACPFWRFSSFRCLFCSWARCSCACGSGLLLSTPSPSAFVGTLRAESGILTSQAGRLLVLGTPFCTGGVLSIMGSSGIAGGCVVGVWVRSVAVV